MDKVNLTVEYDGYLVRVIDENTKIVIEMLPLHDDIERVIHKLVHRILELAE